MDSIFLDVFLLTAAASVIVIAVFLIILLIMALRAVSELKRQAKRLGDKGVAFADGIRDIGVGLRERGSWRTIAKIFSLFGRKRY